MNKKVLLAFSGGVDSSAAVEVLREQGFEVVGLTIDMLGDHDFISKAKKHAMLLGIEHYVEPAREIFKDKVVDYFVESYMHGLTPSPCTVCNVKVKWKILRDVADRMGIYYIATGHYANKTERKGVFYIEKGIDPLKDQSYYLWALGQDILARAIFPMGGRIKHDVKQSMTDKGFDEIALAAESMSVCFVGKQGYAEFLQKHKPEVNYLQGGQIIDLKGNVLGYHRGYPFYTAAQKKNLEIDKSLNYSVLRVDAENNRVIVGDGGRLYHSSFVLSDYSIVDREEFFDSDKLKVIVRGIGINPEGFCRVNEESGKLYVECDNPAWALAPGQPVVFYIENRVVGGGFIFNF